MVRNSRRALPSRKEGALMQLPLFCAHPKYWRSRRLARCIACVPPSRVELDAYDAIVRARDDADRAHGVLLPLDTKELDA